MPIRPENKARYPKDWKAISLAVREAAGNRCEGSPDYPDCRAENRKPHPDTGSMVVLTVAHLDHTPENCDRAHHDHPWLFNASWLLDGPYVEHTITAGGALVKTPRKAGDFKFRMGKAPHRVELITEVFEGVITATNPCWTVFITGPRVREWGFYCMERGWIHWKKFTAPDDKGAVGKGCDA